MFEIDTSMQNFCNYKYSLQKEHTVMPLMRKHECILPPTHAHQNTHTFLKITVFWKVTLCNLVFHYCCSREPVASIFRENMEATSSSKTLVTILDYMVSHPIRSCNTAMRTSNLTFSWCIYWQHNSSHFSQHGISLHLCYFCTKLHFTWPTLHFRSVKISQIKVFILLFFN